LYILFVYASYNVSGEAALAFAVIVLILTYPSGLLLVYLSSLIEPSGPMENNVFYASYFIFGYCQWFILLPWLINKVISIGLHKHGNLVHFEDYLKEDIVYKIRIYQDKNDLFYGQWYCTKCKVYGGPNDADQSMKVIVNSNIKNTGDHHWKNHSNKSHWHNSTVKI